MEEPAAPRAAAEPDRPTRRSLLRQERSKQTRRLLIRTAARLWSERGYDAVTVEEVCSAAGVGRTTFYLHFESKEQLLAGLASGTAMGVEADLEDPQGLRHLDEQLGIFIAGVARRMEAVPKSLAELVIHSYRMPLRAGRTEGRRFADTLADLLAAAQDGGQLAAGADPAELGDILGALTMDAIETWAVRDGVCLAEVLRYRFDLVLDRYRRDGRGPT